MKTFFLATALAALLFGVAAAVATNARADAPASVRAPIVVDVDPAVTEIDPATLRAAIGYELGAIAVAPDDPVAAQAHGTVTVSVDRASRKLVVSYRENGAPLTRSVALPGDAGAIAQEAVLLAGNLARDEAAELLADLGRNRATAATTPAPAQPTVEEQAAAQTAVDARDLERMRVALTPYTPADRSARIAVAWTIQGLALLGAGATLYWEFSHSFHADTWAGVASSTLLCCWVFPLAQSFLPSADLDVLREYYEKDRATGRPAGMVLDDVEEQWVAAARVERGRRRFSGWLTLSGGALIVALGAYEIQMAGSAGNGAGYFYGYGGAELASGVFAFGWGAHIILTEGPIESALSKFREASGRPIGDVGRLVVEPRMAFVPGGGVLGLGGSF
jgi:hypothetical protein